MIFIDSGALIAKHHASDQYHKEAVRLWDRILQEKKICVTSNFVLNETFTLLSRRISYSAAVERARAIYLSQRLTVLRPTEEDEMGSLTLMEKYADQEIGFTDCVSFVLMRKKRIQTVFTFDRHFTLAGFERWS